MLYFTVWARLVHTCPEAIPRLLEVWAGTQKNYTLLVVTSSCTLNCSIVNNLSILQYWLSNISSGNLPGSPSRFPSENAFIAQVVIVRGVIDRWVDALPVPGAEPRSTLRSQHSTSVSPHLFSNPGWLSTLSRTSQHVHGVCGIQ